VRGARAQAEIDGDLNIVAELDKDYEYMGKQTCAVDSMCLRACPVGIDTGKFIKDLRNKDATKIEQTVWKGAATSWSGVNRAASVALSGAHRLPTGLVQTVTDIGRALVGAETLPQYQPELPAGGSGRAKLGGIHGDTNSETQAAYIPARVYAKFAQRRV